MTIRNTIAVLVWTIWDRLRNIWARLWWGKRYWCGVLLAVISFFTALCLLGGFVWRVEFTRHYWAGILTMDNATSALLAITAIALAVATIVLSLASLLDSTIRHATFDIIPISLMTLHNGQKSEQETTNTFYGNRGRKESILYNKNVNRVINASSNTVLFVKEEFQIHPLVQELLPLLMTKLEILAPNHPTDDAKVRLCSDISEYFFTEKQPVYFQKTSYYRDIFSNTLANYSVELKQHEVLNLRKEALSAEGRLLGLHFSPLSNQLGGSTLLVTSDPAVIVQRQGTKSAHNTGNLAPTGSGSFDWLAVKRRRDVDFQTIAREESARELCEECGIARKDILSIHICGFGRYLYRNGKPEIFCLATTRLHSQDLKILPKEFGHQAGKVIPHLINGELTTKNVLACLEDLKSSLEKQAQENDTGNRRVSGPLYWNTLFAIDYLNHIKNDKSVADDLFGALANYIAASRLTV